jgi:hypothetical protein
MKKLLFRFTKENMNEHPLRTLWYRLTCYVVVAKWEGIESVRFARDYEDALGWARCYPANATVMIGKRGRLIGARF